MAAIKDYKVGDKVVTLPYWGVKTDTVGEVISVDDSTGNLRIKWPEGLIYKDGKGYYVQIGGTCGMGNSECIELAKEVKDMPEGTIAGVRLSKANQAKLVEAAREAAENLGYCDEVDNVLAELGFDIPGALTPFNFYIGVEVKLPTNRHGELTEDAQTVVNNLLIKRNITVGLHGVDDDAITVEDFDYN